MPRAGFSASLFALLVLAACGPSAGTARDSSSSAAPAPVAQRTLQIGMQAVSEPPTISDHGIGNLVGGREHYFMFHAPLTAYDGSEGLLPRLAEKIPSVADGDWTLLPDGGMEVTWKLRSNALWHDGTPLTAEDFVFGFQVVKDPELAVAAPAVATIA